MDLNDNPLVRWLEKVFGSDLVFPLTAAVIWGVILFGAARQFLGW